MDAQTCYGLGCLNMEDLYVFIVELKEMDLYAVARQTCCDDVLIDGNCECPEEIDQTPFEQ